MQNLPPRRVLVAGGVVLACGALAVSGVLTANAATRPAPPAPAAPAAPAPAAAPEPSPWGKVIDTNLTAKGERVVFYGIKVGEKTLPQTHFGVMAGVREKGAVKGLEEANEFAGADDAPGFHAVSGPLGADGYPLPSFGYYAGPAAKITAKIQGKDAVAHQAKWSVNPDIVIFWFDQTSGDPDGLAAFDAAGKQLPTGNSGVGHG